MPEELVHFDDCDGKLVVIEQFLLVVKLHLVTVVLRQSPWERVRELETDEVQVLENGRFVLLHHVADVAGYIEHDSLPVNGTAIVLDFDGDAVAGSLPFTIVGQQQVRLGVPVAEFARDEGVHEFRVIDAVGTDKVQGRVDEVGREFVEELGKFFSGHWCPYSR